MGTLGVRKRMRPKSKWVSSEKNNEKNFADLHFVYVIIRLFNAVDPQGQLGGVLQPFFEIDVSGLNFISSKQKLESESIN